MSEWTWDRYLEARKAARQSENITARTNWGRRRAWKKRTKAFAAEKEALLRYAEESIERN